MTVGIPCPTMRSSTSRYGVIIFVPRVSLQKNRQTVPRKSDSWRSKGVRYVFPHLFHEDYSPAVAAQQPGLQGRIRRVGTQPDGEKRSGEIIAFDRALHHSVYVHLNARARLVNESQPLTGHRKLENGLGSTPGPEETDRPGDGRTEGRNREEPERVGTLAPTGGGSQAGSGSIGAGGSLGAANQRLGAGYPSIGSGTGRSSKHGLYGHSRGWSAARPSPGSGGARRVAAPAGRPKRSNVPVVAARHPPPPLTLTPPAAPLALPWIAGSSGCPSGWQPSRRGPSTALSAIGLRRAPRGPYRASDRA